MSTHSADAADLAGIVALRMIAARAADGHDPRRGRHQALLLAALVLAGCVSPPRPAGPVRLEGPIPPPGATASASAPESRVAQGPLLLRNADLDSGRDDDYVWSVQLVNPSSATFDVSLVVILLDENDRPVGSVVRDLRIDGGDTSALSGTVAAAAPPSRFRVEYWVRLLPPPERRTERVGS